MQVARLHQRECKLQQGGQVRAHGERTLLPVRGPPTAGGRDPKLELAEPLHRLQLYLGLPLPHALPRAQIGRGAVPRGPARHGASPDLGSG